MGIFDTRSGDFNPKRPGNTGQQKKAKPGQREESSGFDKYMENIRSNFDQINQDCLEIQANLNKMQRAFRGSPNRGNRARGRSSRSRPWSRIPGMSSVDSRPRPRDNVKEVEGPDQAKRARIEENTMENKIPIVSRTRIEGPDEAKRAKIEENTIENKIPIVSRTRIEETLRDIKCCGMACGQYGSGL